MKQQSFFPKPPLFHGGELGQGKRKTRRPLCSKRPVHIVLKAKSQNLYANKAWIESKTRCLAERFHVKIYSLAVNFDHVHLVLKLPNRRAYAAFMRALTGLLARKIGTGLWKLLPFTRVLAWGRDFRQALHYLRKNREEAAGARLYEKRKNWYGRHKPA
jgi:REP element-mobilizing transposase RayT